MIIDYKEIESDLMVSFGELGEKFDSVAYKIVEWQFKGCYFLIQEYDFREKKFLNGNKFG